MKRLNGNCADFQRAHFAYSFVISNLSTAVVGCEPSTTRSTDHEGCTVCRSLKDFSDGRMPSTNGSIGLRSAHWWFHGLHLRYTQRLNAYLRLRLAHAHAKQLHIRLELERAAAEILFEDSENGSGDSPSGRRHRHRRHRTPDVQQLKEDYDAAKSALLDAHKRAAGLAWRRDGMGQLVRDFGTWTIREEV